MAVVVENSADQIEAMRNGGVFPVPAEVKADNEAQAAKKSTKTEVPKVEDKPKVETIEEQAQKEVAALDDVEGEDGLTPRQKREFTKAMQATIGKKHRMQKEAEEFAQEQYKEAKLAESRAAKLEADLAALKEQLKPPAAEIKEPVRADFKDDQTYWDAMVDFRVDKKLRASQAAQAQVEQERFIQEESQHAQAKMDRGLEQGPEDFKEVYEGADMVLPNYVLEAIKTSDLMPELVYFLGSNPDRADKLRAMTDGCPPGSARYARAAQRQLVELGKIESTLKPFSKEKADPDGEKPKPETAAKAEPETGTTPSKPRVQAPIIKPLNAGSAAQVKQDDASMTTSQTITAWQKKHGVVLTARKRH
jgi:hypothetical protein